MNFSFNFLIAVALGCALVLMLTGCGSIDRTTAKWAGHSKVCVDGVSYIQFTSGASVQYTSDGEVVTCEK